MSLSENDVDAEELDLTPEERENLANEKLLQRLYKAAGKELGDNAVEYEGEGDDHL